MNHLHAHPHAGRFLLVMLTAVALLAAMSAVAAPAAAPITSEQFAPGWQDHSQSLINVGIQRGTGRDRWHVPNVLPRGEYVLVSRTGDKAVVIREARLIVKSGFEDQYLFLESGYGDVQAVPIADVPALKPVPSSTLYMQ